ncbi:hypothetical protein K438DRAFT_1961619 [Mycena galopus ATCC 62051]|nr:hypothetical protein K438DRAFT_1961619 [Mycena galopus ATCC 62051]
MAASISTSQMAIIGPVIVAVGIESFLLGGVLTFGGLYYLRFHLHDGGLYGFIVGALLILNALEAGTDIDVAYHVAITHPNDPDILQTWALWLQPAVLAVIGTLAHAFFIECCWRTAKKSSLVFAGLALCGLLSFGSGLAVSATSFHSKSTPSTSSIPMSIWLASTAATALAIAAILLSAHLLHGASARLSWIQPQPRGQAQVQAQSGRTLKRILELTVQTGAVSALTAMVNLILFFVKAGTEYHLLAQYAMGPVYTLTVLATLLARRVPDHAAASSFALGTHMAERPADKLKVNVHRVIETDLPGDGSVHGTDTDTPTDSKVTWAANAV